MKDDVTGMEYDPGYTKTHLAMELARTEIFQPAGGDRENITNVVMILTNERPSIYQKMVEAAEELQGVATVYAVGVGDMGRDNITDILQIMSSQPKEPGKNYFTASFEDLEQIVDPVLGSLCGPTGRYGKMPS